ncbi:ABC transporter permease [Planosporangium thailandense]|uniref:ABC transporter permease n=1 Tax=Planosporangium thailandense TaxID=765197 RepID=A0ABX0Y5V7_9ACTN|nr:ABC transporter permease [Planosporangium thailandense]NJC72803.1 ABC transporter permease [Planosporangium thailandense]
MMRLSGRLRSSLIIGGQGIRARKLRTLLSMVSLFLGVLAVVVVQAGASIAEHALLSEAELTQGKDGTRQLFLPTEGGALPVTLDTLRGRSDAVAAIQSMAIIGEPRVRPVNPGAGRIDDPAGSGPEVVCDPRGCHQVGDAAEAPPGKAIALQLTALTGDIRTFRPFRPYAGQWLDFSSAPSLSPRIVLNREAAKGFARYHVPAQMRIDGATADATPRIIGVVDDGGYQPAAYVRADELLNWLPETALAGDRGASMLVLSSPDATAVERTLRARLVGAGMAPDAIHVETLDARGHARTELAIMRWIFLGMAGLVLLIGVAGILNVGLATVGERIEEFALRRAVGTPRSLLAGIVLSETLLTGLLTAAAAIGVSAVALRAVGAVLGDRVPLLQGIVFPWQAGVAGVVAGLVAGLLGGFIPALRAARIPIATVMRA